MEIVELHAHGLVLNQPTVADIPLITEYCRDPLFEKFMTLPWPYAREHAEFFVNEYVPGAGREATRSRGRYGRAARFSVSLACERRT